MQKETRVRSSDPLRFCIWSLHHDSRVGDMRPFIPKLSTAAFLFALAPEDFDCCCLEPAGAMAAAGPPHAACADLCCALNPATIGVGVTTAATGTFTAPPQAVDPPEAAIFAQPPFPPPPPLPPPPPPLGLERLMPCSLARLCASLASSCWISDMDFLRDTLVATAPPHATGAAGAGSGATGEGAWVTTGSRCICCCCCFFLLFFEGAGAGWKAAGCCSIDSGGGRPATTTSSLSDIPAPAAPRPSIIFSCAD
mmetsp:Transcript_24439/g.46802  ORF Transcript_24439/g.46802 Transcript_24439/m.46802 type:complete len:253 (+) Transcript_24439:431-1189(+)